MFARRFIAVAAFGACLLSATSAVAAVGFELHHWSFADQKAKNSSALTVQGPCQLLPASGNIALPLVAEASKTAALLGGQPSKFELMIRQQSGESRVELAEPTPDAGGMRSGCLSSAAFVDPHRQTMSNLGMHSIPGANDFLNSKRLLISHTHFDAAWDRVNHQGLSRDLERRMIPIPANAGLEATVSGINAWANSKIRYVEDIKQYGVADYWAEAKTTLLSRAGDCEDIAIVKMQLLAAAGIPRSDMFLTIARDLVRNADHALLVVRMEGRFVVLDNSTNALLDANAPLDYRPIMSFSDNGKWLHGY